MNASGSVTSLMSRHDQLEAGRALRAQTPRDSHSSWQPAAGRNPLELLRGSNAGRLKELIPVRYQRMAASPFAFFRGADILMAADLKSAPVSGLRMPICGDCHLQNFGWFASPERELVFDITDFDETIRGPWEFDIKRLAVSAVLAARAIGRERRHQEEMLAGLARDYRQWVREYSHQSTLTVWYERLNSRHLMKSAERPSQQRALREVLRSARNQTVARLMTKKELITAADGSCTITDSDDIHHRSKGEWSWLTKNVPVLLERYAQSLQADRRELLSRFQVADVAWKIAGIGSVGLRCGIILLRDADDGLLLLQVKEARDSVLAGDFAEPVGIPQGQRVVEGQRVMQAVSDVFLGWASDDSGHDCYLRQLRDMKRSIDTSELSYQRLCDFSRLCGRALARAHAKSGLAPAMTGYLGKSEAFDKALTRFALAYSDQVEKDYSEFVTALGDKGML